MSRHKNRAVLVALVLALVAAACGGDDGSSADRPPSPTAAPGTTAAEPSDRLAPRPLPTKTKVTLGAPSALEVFSSMFMADALGEFEAENLDVEIVSMPPNDAYLAMSRGDLDMYAAGVNAGYINLVNTGIDIRWVANTHGSSPDSEEGLWVRNEVLGPDGDLADDAPDRLSMAMGAAGKAAASIVPVSGWLESQGLTFDDVEVSNLSGNDIVVALDTGAIQAGYLPSPGYLVIAESGCCTLVTGQPPFTAATFAMSGTFIDDEPEAAEAVVRAMARTNRDHLQGDYHADDEVAAAMSDLYGLPVEALRQTTPLVFDPALRLDVAAIEQLQDLWIEQGVLELDAPVPIDRLTDPSVVERAIGQG